MHQVSLLNIISQGWWFRCCYFYNCIVYNLDSIRVPQPRMPQTTTTQHTQQRTTDFKIKYKTEVHFELFQKCRYLIDQGYCPFRQQCTFAHSDMEVRGKDHLSQKYRTKPCINFTFKGYCNYGTRCHYLHLAQKDTDSTEEGQKTRSNSEESDCSSSSSEDRSPKVWNRLSHSKRIDLIQTLGLDYSIRTSSRLMQLLSSNESEQNWREWMFAEEVVRIQVSPKKYSL